MTVSLGGLVQQAGGAFPAEKQREFPVAEWLSGYERDAFDFDASQFLALQYSGEE